MPSLTQVSLNHGAVHRVPLTHKQGVINRIGHNLKVPRQAVVTREEVSLGDVVERYHGRIHEHALLLTHDGIRPHTAGF